MKNFLVLIALGFIAFGASLIPRSASAPVPSCADCNVVIIGVDTLRADTVHAFGYPRPTTPTIDVLAAKGVSFTQAISASSWTVPSFMSLFTGVYPSVHKVTNKFAVFTPTEQKLSNLAQLSPGTRTLAQAFHDAGYATGGFTGDAGVSAKFGYGQGFDAYTDEAAFGGLANSETHALAWLDSIGDRKFFLFLHGYDLHGQFDIPEGNRVFVAPGYAGPYTGSATEEAKLREDQLAEPLTATPDDVAFWRGLYDSKVFAADTKVAAFLSALDARGLTGKTIIVLVSDHGEEYFEHNGIDHGHSLYDELVRVPLIFVAPGIAGNVRVPSQVSMMDVGSTILALAGVRDSAWEKQTGGRTLLGYFGSPERAGEDVFTETDYRDFTHKRSVRTADGWKYILTLGTRKEELYDLSNDPGEASNVLSEYPVKARELAGRLRAHIRDDLHADPDTAVTAGCLPVYQGECE